MSLAPVRVLHVMVAGDLGGAERLVINLARPARGSGATAEHHVVALTSNPRLRDALAQSQVPSDVYPWRDGTLSSLKAAAGRRARDWVIAAARACGAHLLHLHTYASHVVGARAAAALGVPFVRTEHSRRVYDDWSCRALSRWSLHRAATVVAVSADLEALVRAREPRVGRRLALVPNGVDVPAHPAALPQASPFGFVVVARLEPRKGVDLALDALALIPGVRLAIVGDGPERARLERQARRLAIGDRVSFLGWQTDPTPHVAAAHALLVPSRTEGLSVAALEAMALGRPVVARAVGGLPELVRPALTGWLAPDGSIAALAAAMLAAAGASSSELSRLGQGARALVTAAYSHEAMRTGYERVYATALTHAEPRRDRCRAPTSAPVTR